MKCSFICVYSDPNQILGFAGMPKEGRTVSNLKYYRTGQFITGTQVQTKTEVCSIDECCFAMTKDLYARLSFDEHTCSHWHLYAVDFCYAANFKFGAKSYVLPETIYHKEDGTTGLQTDRHFLRTMWKMTRKYCRTLPTIYTPCYIISTDPMSAFCKISRSIIKNVIRR